MSISLALRPVSIGLYIQSVIVMENNELGVHFGLESEMKNCQHSSEGTNITKDHSYIFVVFCGYSALTYWEVFPVLAFGLQPLKQYIRSFDFSQYTLLKKKKTTTFRCFKKSVVLQIEIGHLL